MALWIGAPPSDDIRDRVTGNLVAKIEHLIALTANATSTQHPPGIDFVGGVGQRYLWEALARSGRADTALKLLLKPSYPGYGYMFLNKFEPATALWELWNSDSGDPTMDSRSHLYSSSISTFMFKYLAGIRALAPGYARVLIAPYTGGTNVTALKSVEAQLGTPHGAIVSSWSVRAPPPNPLCSSGPLTTCAMVEEGNNGPNSAHLCVGCSDPGAVIRTVLFASFGSASPDAGLGSCVSGLHVGTCGGGVPRGRCHPCTNCPACQDGRWPNASAIVSSMCVGKDRCVVPVSFDLFGDTCEGKKILAVQVQCSAASTQPPNHHHHPSLNHHYQQSREHAVLRSPAVYTHNVTVPVGMKVDVVVPSHARNISNPVIMEGTRVVWENRSFVPGVVGVVAGVMDKSLGGVKFSIMQGSYAFQMRI